MQSWDAPGCSHDVFLLQFLGLPVIDVLNDEEEPLMIRNSKDLFFHFQLLGVTPACSGAPESKFPL